MSPGSGPPDPGGWPAENEERGRLEFDQPVGARMSWDCRDGLLRIQFDGEFCAWVAQRIEPVLAGLLDELSPWALVVELSGVRFLDAAGLTVLIRLRRQAVERAAQLTLESPSPAVRRVLELCDLAREFGIS